MTYVHGILVVAAITLILGLGALSQGEGWKRSFDDREEISGGD